jgi:SAM-dependent methyltransferase
MIVPSCLRRLYYQVKYPADTKKYNTLLPYFNQLNGCEIGGPTTLFYPIYNNIKSCDCINYSSNTVWTGELTTDYVIPNKILGKQFIMDGTNLENISDNTYDFILSSNNLEHIANPLKAILEWKRVLRGGGLLLILVPQKEFTFDHKREITEFTHIIIDFEEDIKEDDLTHLDEILKNHDLNMDKTAGTYDEFKRRSLNNVENRCLHHHVYSLDTLEQMLLHCDIAVITKFSVYKNHVILGRKLNNND